MAKNVNFTCDGCYKTLNGRVKNQIVNHDHIQINGQIILQEFDKETGWRNHTFITPSQDEQLSFCQDTWKECLESYIETRKMLWS